METVENAVALIDQEKFGALIKLPEILSSSRASVSKAALVADALVKDLRSDNMQTVDALMFEAKIEKAAAIRAKLSLTLDTIENARKPHTEFFDSIRSLFTTEEQRIKAMIEKIKTIQNEWEKVKHHRNKLAKEKTDKEIAEKQKAIELKAQREKALQMKFSDMKYKEIHDLNSRFNEKPVEKLDEAAEKLAAWVPSLQPKWVEIYQSAGMPTDEVPEEMRRVLFDEYESELTEAKQRLIDSIPARKQADEKTRKAHDEAEKGRLENQRRAEELGLINTINAKLEGDKVDAIMDASLSATPTVGAAKGSSISKKYIVESNGTLARLIAEYVSNILPSLDFDDAMKKFSFVVTASNKNLNLGLVIEGIKTEDEFSTRTASIK
jgi:hypothetical protein